MGSSARLVCRRLGVDGRGNDHQEPGKTRISAASRRVVTATPPTSGDSHSASSRRGLPGMVTATSQRSRQQARVDDGSERDAMRGRGRPRLVWVGPG